MTLPARVVLLEPQDFSSGARAVLETIGTVVERPCSGLAELPAAIADADVLFVRLRHTIAAELLAAAPRLVAIASPTTGLDHLDLEAAARRGVTVLSLKGETAFLQTITATAEHSWALLLALVRRVPAAVESVRAGNWDRDLFRGHELQDRRLGVVGLGRIGRMVARYGAAFGMRVTAYDPFVPPALDGVARVDSLQVLCAQSDVLTIHVPLEASTRGLIGREALQALPDGAVLVNTSRGELVDEAALVEALEGGRLAGAALDVVAAERGERPLLQRFGRSERLLVTPHLGGATWESMAKTERFVAEKVVRFWQERGEAS